ncbi:MAG TPA: hypothetical protein VEO54_10035 [Thermoanaerobaculia bacterium]|nr:hypothetical protein [Thermoanaerobaculia bacterium]
MTVIERSAEARPAMDRALPHERREVPERLPVIHQRALEVAGRQQLQQLALARVEARLVVRPPHGLAFSLRHNTKLRPASRGNRGEKMADAQVGGRDRLGTVADEPPQTEIGAHSGAVHDTFVHIVTQVKYAPRGPR